MKSIIQTNLAMIILFWALISWAEHYQPHGIIIDGTIGSKNYAELQGPDYKVLSEYGEIKGNNLFHSFQTFNVHNNEQATFYGPNNIQNIISRVTGSEHSWLDGSIQSMIPEANFFLFNPNGVVFGPNVHLDIQGSFHVSTCDNIGFSDQTKFKSTSNSPVLTSALPVSFGFIDNKFAQIHIHGKGYTIAKSEHDLQPSLVLKNGKTLSLIAGDIVLDDGTVDAAKNDPHGTIISDKGRVNIASVASTGEVIFQNDGLDVSSFEKMGNIILSDHSIISSSSGQIYIYGNHLEMKTSYINAGQYRSGENTIEGFAGGSIDIHVKQLSILDGSGIFIETYSTKNSGDINIYAENIILKGSYNEDKLCKISTSSVSPDIIDAFDSTDKPNISITNDQTFGNAGNINIYTENLSLADGATIKASAFSNGDGGQIKIDASETVDISGNLKDFCGVLAVSLSARVDAGHAGDIKINAKHLIIQNGGKIKTSTGGTANSGTIDIQVEETLLIESVDQEFNCEDPEYEKLSGIFSSTYKAIEYEGKGGDAGKITISGKTLQMKQFSKINASSESSGRAGCIHLDFESVEMGRHTFIISASKFDGNSGYVLIQSEDFISLNQYAMIGTQSLGSGNSGGIFIDTPRLLIDNLSTVSATSMHEENTKDGIGLVIGRDIVIDETESSFEVHHECDHISIKGQSEVSTESYGKGKAGLIYIASQNIEMDEQSKISSSSMKYGDNGDSGKIYLNSNQVSLNHESIITTENAGKGDAGGILIGSQNMILSFGSRISSESTSPTQGGAAGHIHLEHLKNLTLKQNSKISTQAVKTSEPDTIIPGLIEQDRLNGMISIKASGSINLFDGKISSSVLGGLGNGGNISIRSKNLILNQGQIIANAYKGNGGNIYLTADQLIQSSDSVISASSQLGIDGNIMIEANIVNFDNQLISLADNFLNGSKWLQTACDLREYENASHFIISLTKVRPRLFADWKPAR